MKNSEISWIDGVPEDWEVKRFKDVAICNAGFPAPSEEFLLSSDSEEGINFLRISDLSNNTEDILFTKDKVKQGTFTKKFKTGTIVFPKSGESIRTNVRAILNKDMYVVSHLACLSGKKNINNKFLFYFLKLDNFENLINQTALPALGLYDIKNNKIVLPNLNKQIKITNYLDQETSKIDRKISILEQKYEKLEEYKQSVIFETVTKGLDHNVEMKDSGIDWIGKIPEHWEVKRVKEFYKLGMGQTILKEDLIEDGKYPVYSATAEDKFFGYVNKINNPLNVGDLVIPARGNSIGHVKLVKETVVCTQTTIYMKQKTKIDSNFVYYYLLGNKPQLFFFDDTAIPQITVEQINGRLILVPSANEQKEIVSYLNNLCSKLNKKLEIIKKQLELLKEYKQTIIYEAVTGKMEIL